MADDSDAQRLRAIEKAVNDSAGRASVLWTSFLTLGAYLAIATGSVTHRDLFVNSAMKLPVVGVELPATGYFLVAPLIYLIFHFYLLLQFEGLSEKVTGYNEILNETVKVAADRRRARWSLDDLPFLRFQAGEGERRFSLVGNLDLLISWITIVLFPIVILLQLQVAFLPYHSEPITWLHRACLICDLGLIWFFWRSFRRGRAASPWPRALGAVGEGGGALLVVFFSFMLATFPGEIMYRNPVARAIDVIVASALRDQSLSVSKYLFEGAIDSTSGHSSSLFVNRIILNGERIYDASKKIESSVSVRGRDFRGAVFSRSDLSFADFTGSSLVEASFLGTRLQQARFGCAAKRLPTALSEQLRTRASVTSCDEDHTTDLRGANFSEAQLQGASFDGSKLIGARFAKASMQGVTADGADLTATTFTYARLESASLTKANLAAASLFSAQMQGANLADADLSMASFLATQLQGANLKGARLENAVFSMARVYRAVIDEQRKGAIFIRTNARPIYPRLLLPGSAERNDSSLPEKIDAIGFKTLLGRAQEGILGDDTRRAVVARMQVLDPAKEAQQGSLVSDQPINSDEIANEKIRIARADEIIKLICNADGAPYAARGVIYNGRILGIVRKQAPDDRDPALRAIASLRSGTCQGAVGLDANDFRELERVERQVQRMKHPNPSADDNDDDDDDKDSK